MNSRRKHFNRTESVPHGCHANRPHTRQNHFMVCAMVSIALVTVTTVGCRSLRPSDGEGLFADYNLLSTDAIRGPLERAFQDDEDVLTLGEKFSAEALEELDVARTQFDEGQYKEAARSFDRIANKYPESSIGEEAWFRQGEAYYALNDYPSAQDCYDKLFKDYPSTKYVATASERLFSIARIWLEVTDPVAKSAIKTVSATAETQQPEPQKSAGGFSAEYGLIPNFFDPTRPLLDTRGRAREALKSVWLNDPTGPLADDALMLTATYHLRKGDNVEADRYFEILRDEYPDSPHLEDAFLLGGHVKQVSYQGPYYDDSALKSAEQIKERTLQMFPNSTDRQQVREDLSQIYLLRAQRAWSQVELWRRKGNPRAVAIASMQLINEYPDTPFADQARTELLAIDRSLLADLPGMTQFLDSLPTRPINSQPVDPPEDRGTRVKSVSSQERLSSESPFGPGPQL